MADGGAGHVDEVEISQGPFPIDLNAAALSAGAVTKVFDAQVPAGTYEELKLEIFPSAALKDASQKDASVIVDGRSRTEPSAASPSASVRRWWPSRRRKVASWWAAAPPTSRSLIDPQQWFGTAAAPLDPTVPSNQTAIEANIRRSIDVFQDDDGSGHENHDSDHDEHRDGGHRDGGHG